MGKNGYNSRHLVVFQRTSRDPHLAFGNELGQYLACSMYLMDPSRLALDVLVFFFRQEPRSSVMTAWCVLVGHMYIFNA